MFTLELQFLYGKEGVRSASSSSMPASQFKDGTKTKAHSEELPNCLEPS